MLSIEAIRLNASTLSLTLLFLVGFYLIYKDMRKMEESWKKLDASVTEMAAVVSDISSALEMPFDFPDVCQMTPVEQAGGVVIEEEPVKTSDDIEEEHSKPEDAEAAEGVAAAEEVDQIIDEIIEDTVEV